MGPLFVIASASAIHAISFEERAVPFVTDQEDQTLFHCTREQLSDYFAGCRRTFDLPLALESGTDFQRAVWRELTSIPFGETTTYRALAGRLGSASAARAVGAALGRNPFMIVTPCHRVIASDGTLGGFAGGLPAKRRLLKLEQTEIRE